MHANCVYYALRARSFRALFVVMIARTAVYIKCNVRVHFVWFHFDRWLYSTSACTYMLQNCIVLQFIVLVSCVCILINAFQFSTNSSCKFVWICVVSQPQQRKNRFATAERNRNNSSLPPFTSDAEPQTKQNTNEAAFSARVLGFCQGRPIASQFARNKNKKKHFPKHADNFLVFWVPRRRVLLLLSHIAQRTTRHACRVKHLSTQTLSLNATATENSTPHLSIYNYIHRIL